jgi:hypothetical protein
VKLPDDDSWRELLTCPGSAPSRSPSLLGERQALRGTKVACDTYQLSVYPTEGVFSPLKGLLFFSLLVLLSLCVVPTDAQSAAQPDPLVTTIQSLDTKLFDAYNHCDLKTLGTMVSDDLEFYHDLTGLSVGKETPSRGVHIMSQR